MDKLKILWLETKVQFNGKGIVTAWGEEMSRQGWEIITDGARWEEADLIFFGSDSQLTGREHMLGQKPTICYFWGWWPGRFILSDTDFREHAGKQLELMSRCTRVLVPSWATMEQAAGYGLPSEVCLPGIDTKPLSYNSLQPEQGLSVVWISRLAPHKNLMSVIDALGMLEPASVKLTVCGPGEEEIYARRADELGVNVRFIEPNDYAKAFEIKSARFLIHSSVYEGFGLPPLEALYCGIPVLSFDTPHNRWLLQEDADYFSSPEGLAHILFDVFNVCENGQYPAYEPYLAKAKKASRRIANTYNLEQACGRLWAHIHQTIKQHLAWELRDKPKEWSRIYDAEHRRNWAYSIDRFDPTWARHWRAQTFIQKLQESGAQRILDVGCGAVYPTIFGRAGFDVVALDISIECLNQVLAVAKKWGVDEKVKTVCGDADDLMNTVTKWPDTEPPYDAVILGEILEHVPDATRILDQALQTVKVGGVVIATTPIGEHHYDPMHFRIWDDDTITALAESRKDAELLELSKVAEEGCDPSCYLFVLKKLEETTKAKDNDPDGRSTPGID